MTLYRAFSAQGQPLFEAKTNQALGNFVANWIETNSLPPLGYTYQEGTPFPYVTWKRHGFYLEGTPHRYITEALQCLRLG